MRQRSVTELKFTLLDKTIKALKEAKDQGSKQFREIEDKIEDLFMGQLEMPYFIARQYIDEAKKRI